MASKKRSDREARKFLAANPDIVTVDMLVPDMNGILRGKQLTHEYLPKLYTEGVRMPGSIYLLDWTGQNIGTLDYGSSDGDPDFLCFPVEGTLARIDWARRPSAQVIASMVDADGVPHFADPRHILTARHGPVQGHRPDAGGGHRVRVLLHRPGGGGERQHHAGAGPRNRLAAGDGERLWR